MGNTFSHLAACSGELSTSPQPGFFELSQRLWALWATRSVVSSSRAERPARTWCKLESEAVDGTELNRSEVHRGVAVIIFMQADHFADQWPGDENQLALPFNLAVAADPAQCEVAGVGRICEPGRIGSRRRRVNRRRHRLAQGFVRALMVKLCTEIIEAALLGGERGRRRLRGFRLEGLVHAFMPSVLLGLARHDAHRRNAQLDPPHRQSAQAAGRQRGKRRTIIGEQYLRQAVLAKKPLECAPAACIVGGDRAAAQQVTAEGVGHGQGITGRAIAGAEPALEVDAPDIIGRPTFVKNSVPSCTPKTDASNGIVAAGISSCTLRSEMRSIPTASLTTVSLAKRSREDRHAWMRHACWHGGTRKMRPF